MTQYQTCRRHPDRRFLRTCGGCAQELHDLQARNEAMSAAREALAPFGIATLEVTDAKFMTRGGVRHLVVASRNEASAWFCFGVDVFRLATATETDPELGEGALPVGSWVLVDQWGGVDEAEHAGQWAQARAEYGPKPINLTATLAA